MRILWFSLCHSQREIKRTRDLEIDPLTYTLSLFRSVTLSHTLTYTHYHLYLLLWWNQRKSRPRSILVRILWYSLCVTRWLRWFDPRTTTSPDNETATARRERRRSRSRISLDALSDNYAASLDELRSLYSEHTPPRDYGEVSVSYSHSHSRTHSRVTLIDERPTMSERCVPHVEVVGWFGFVLKSYSISSNDSLRLRDEIEVTCFSVCPLWLHTVKE